jgi:hypothetical protein
MLLWLPHHWCLSTPLPKWKAWAWQEPRALARGSLLKVGLDSHLPAAGARNPHVHMQSTWSTAAAVQKDHSPTTHCIQLASAHPSPALPPTPKVLSTTLTCTGVPEHHTPPVDSPWQ